MTIASASVLAEKIKSKGISKLFLGTDDEVVHRLMDLIENELGEIPAVKLHCPPATVQVFLEAQKNTLTEGQKRLLRKDGGEE